MDSLTNTQTHTHECWTWNAIFDCIDCPFALIHYRFTNCIGRFPFEWGASESCSWDDVRVRGKHTRRQITYCRKINAICNSSRARSLERSHFPAQFKSFSIITWSRILRTVYFYCLCWRSCVQIELHSLPTWRAILQRNDTKIGRIIATSGSSPAIFFHLYINRMRTLIHLHETHKQQRRTEKGEHWYSRSLYGNFTDDICFFDSRRCPEIANCIDFELVPSLFHGKIN